MIEKHEIVFEQLQLVVQLITELVVCSTIMISKNKIRL